VELLASDELLVSSSDELLPSDELLEERIGMYETIKSAFPVRVFPLRN
jgi:hypothetical protein